MYYCQSQNWNRICVCMFLFPAGYTVYIYFLSRFVLMVKRSYRDPPYHNWYHALSVAHFCYVLYQNCDHLSFLSDLEVLALFFSCLCHDIDHRGTNNSFQISSVRQYQSLIIHIYVCVHNVCVHKVCIYVQYVYMIVHVCTL